MPCTSGHTPQQIEALLVLVTDGMVARPRTNRPCLRQVASVGMSLCCIYSRPKPSHMMTTARWGARCAKAGAERSAALAASNSRRDSDDVFMSGSRDTRAGGQHVHGIKRLAGCHEQTIALAAAEA